MNNLEPDINKSATVVGRRRMGVCVQWWVGPDTTVHQGMVDCAAAMPVPPYTSATLVATAAKCARCQAQQSIFSPALLQNRSAVRSKTANNGNKGGSRVAPMPEGTCRRWHTRKVRTEPEIHGPNLFFGRRIRYHLQGMVQQLSLGSSTAE
jgi:hypothetical protein